MASKRLRGYVLKRTPWARLLDEVLSCCDSASYSRGSSVPLSSSQALNATRPHMKKPALPLLILALALVVGLPLLLSQMGAEERAETPLPLDARASSEARDSDHGALPEVSADGVVRNAAPQLEALAVQISRGYRKLPRLDTLKIGILGIEPQ